MNLSNIHTAYFLGIGGIGMSAIARWFNSNGVKVLGYDKTSTRLTDELVSEGIEIHFDDNISNVIQANLSMDSTLVVLTPAIPKDHKEWNYLKEKGFTIKKRSEVLGILTKDNFTIAVAGTHGKTTTSSMIAHVLKHCGLDISAFLGGITVNYNSNLIIGAKSAPVVVEADEFDRSFLTLFPSIAVVTSTDADHLDIYGKHDELKRTFNLFVNQIRENGTLFYQESLDLEFPVSAKAEKYSNIGKGVHYSENIRAEQGISVFDYVSKGFGKKIQGVRLQIPGYHNVENAVAAISVALQMGIPEDRIKSAIESFKGVRRRFEYIIRSQNHV
ncbi:MAG: UDP-N-acetylmuramate--L-alanine ligase, partial [Cytophagales bacterium]|nr:UDP-N-acetylmuramate--L-alanine ligase [Cytophagales bacterium]